MRIERRSKAERKSRAKRKSKSKSRPLASSEPDWSSGQESTSELPDFTDDELNQGELGKVDEHIEALFEEEPGPLKRAGDRVTGRFRSNEEES